MLEYSKILKALENCDFCKLTQDDFIEKVIDLMDTSVIPDKFSYGASKLVLLLPDEDFVVKIPFEGEYYEGEFYQFDGAVTPYSEKEWDYCLVEEYTYKIAEEAGAGDFLLKTFCIGKVGDYPIYVQKKAETYSTRYSSSSKKYTDEEASEIYSKFDIDQLSINWVLDFLSYHTEQDLELLCNLIEESVLSDLHNGNIGYYKDAPVIFDYSGFWD